MIDGICKVKVVDSPEYEIEYYLISFESATFYSLIKGDLHEVRRYAGGCRRLQESEKWKSR